MQLVLNCRWCRRFCLHLSMEMISKVFVMVTVGEYSNALTNLLFVWIANKFVFLLFHVQENHSLWTRVKVASRIHLLQHNLEYSLKIYYPQFKSAITLIANPYSIELSLSVSGAGVVCCTLFLSRYVVNSVQDISSLGKFVNTYNSSSLISMNFTELYPDTMYSAVCFTSGFLQHNMPLSTALLSAVRVRTLCCRQLSFSPAFNNIPQYYIGSSRVEPVFRIKLNSLPEQNTPVVVQFVSASCTLPFQPLQSSVVYPASPSLFIFNSYSLRLYGEFLVRSNYPVCFQVQVTLTLTLCCFSENLATATKIGVFFVVQWRQEHYVDIWFFNWQRSHI